MMFALMTGIPVLTDRLLIEPYFDMKEFKMWQVEDNHWNILEEILNSSQQMNGKK